MIQADREWTIVLLLVEDDPGDVTMTREALERGEGPPRSPRGRQRRSRHFVPPPRTPYADAPRPDLIFLDLNLPRMDGREVLALVKNDESLRRIPLVVLTTSDSQDDIPRSYDLHANAYVTKPVGLESFLTAVRQIDHFFLTVASLPDR